MLFLHGLYFHFTGSQYLIAGGFSNRDPRDDTITEVVELIKNNSTPSFGQLPSTRSGAVGTMFGNAPLLCGGFDDGHYVLDTCISYHQKSEWSKSHSMVQKRRFAAGVKVNSNTFWLLGGSNDTRSDGTNVVLDSTEFIIQGQAIGVPGPKLPYGLIFMCAVKLSENEIFVIGGEDGSSFRSDVWIYDPQNGFARTQGPSLSGGRIYHSCATMKYGEKTVIVMAGGLNVYGQILHSVEIYDPTDNTWQSGKSKIL